MNDDDDFAARLEAIRASDVSEEQKHAQFHALLDEASRSMPLAAVGVVSGCERCPRPSSSILN